MKNQKMSTHQETNRLITQNSSTHHITSHGENGCRPSGLWIREI